MKILFSIILFLLVLTSCFSQTEDDYPRLTVIGKDTFAIIPIKDMKLANGIFVKEGMYKMIGDSLTSLIYVYKDKILIKEEEITLLKSSMDNYKQIADLDEKEKFALQTALDKEKKDYKKYRTKATIVGIIGAALLSVTTTLWLIK
jgi:hypothetical protein